MSAFFYVFILPSLNFGMHDRELCECSTTVILKTDCRANNDNTVPSCGLSSWKYWMAIWNHRIRIIVFGITKQSSGRIYSGREHPLLLHSPGNWWNDVDGDRPGASPKQVVSSCQGNILSSNRSTDNKKVTVDTQTRSNVYNTLDIPTTCRKQTNKQKYVR